MLTFDYVEWRNFQAYGNVLTRLDLNESVRTLIIGTNGNGKSTIVNVLSYVLFNKSFTGGKLSNPRMINSINKKDMYVKIEFETAGKIYTVERGLKPQIFNIFVDGVLVPKPSLIDDYQKYLEKDVLKLTFDAFKQIIILSKVNYNPFMKLTTPKRREVIDALLDLEIFAKMLSILKVKVSENALLLLQNGKDIKSEEEKIALITTHIKSLDEEFEQKNAQLREEVSIFEHDLKEYDGELILLTNKYNELKEKSLKLKGFETADYKLRRKLEELDTKILKCQDHEHLAGTCPTCNQLIPEDKFKAEKEKTKTQIALYDLEKIKIEGQLEQLGVGLEQLKMVDVDLEAYDGYVREHKQSIEQIKYKIKIANEQLSKKSYDKDKLVASIDVIKKKLDNLLSEKSRLLKEKDIHATAAVLLRDNGIKATVIQNYIPEFNRLINQYLSDMNAFYSFELDENFDETISSRHRDEFVYDNFSAGEQQRIDLAILFTWREIAKSRNSMATNLAVFDEVLDGSLDAEGIDDLLKILTRLTGSMFIISHSADMLENFNRVLKVTKKNNFSELEYIQ